MEVIKSYVVLHNTIVVESMLLTIVYMIYNINNYYITNYSKSNCRNFATFLITINDDKVEKTMMSVCRNRCVMS